MPEVERVCGTLARVVAAPIQGAGPARNAAINASRGDVLAFLDSDCRPSPSWIENGLAALGKADLVGGRIEVEFADPERPTSVELFEKVFALNTRHYVEDLGFSAAGNMFVPRRIFDIVGEFRCQVTEDMDWGLRASAANFQWCYSPEAVVSHPARRTWADLLNKWRRRTAEDYALAIEKPNGRAVWFLRSFAILASPFAHWIVVARCDKLESFEQRLRATAVLFPIRFWRFLECNRLFLKECISTRASPGY